MRRENNLGTDSMAGLVVRLAIPAMLAQFINVLYSIVDRIFIGNMQRLAPRHWLVLGSADRLLPSSLPFLCGLALVALH